MEDKMMEMIETEEIEVPKEWDASINLAARQWLKSEYPESICPAVAYLSSGVHRSLHCVNICHKLFPGAKTHSCPYRILELEEVKSKVRGVIKEWENKMIKEGKENWWDS